MRAIALILMGRQRTTSNPGPTGYQVLLPLPLFMFLVRTNYPNHTLPTNDFTLVAHTLNRCSNFHDSKSPSRSSDERNVHLYLNYDSYSRWFNIRRTHSDWAAPHHPPPSLLCLQMIRQSTPLVLFPEQPRCAQSVPTSYRHVSLPSNRHQVV